MHPLVLSKAMELSIVSWWQDITCSVTISLSLPSHSRFPSYKVSLVIFVSDHVWALRAMTWQISVSQILIAWMLDSLQPYLCTAFETNVPPLRRQTQLVWTDCCFFSWAPDEVIGLCLGAIQYEKYLHSNTRVLLTMAKCTHCEKRMETEAELGFTLTPGLCLLSGKGCGSASAI
jgi:hypothetical protein